MKLLSDENFHGDIVRGLFLRQPNLDLVRIQDIGLRAVDDPAILDWAAANDRISNLGRDTTCRVPTGSADCISFFMVSSRTKENGTVLSLVNRPQILTVPCSPFPVPCSLISTVNFNCVHPLIGYSTLNTVLQTIPMSR